MRVFENVFARNNTAASRRAYYTPTRHQKKHEKFFPESIVHPNKNAKKLDDSEMRKEGSNQ